MPKASTSSAILGAAFLMATSAIGPGFLTQTTVFTRSLLSSFGFVILISILLDIGAQLNIWRVLTMSDMRAQDVASKVFPGMGYFVAALVVLGGAVFNIANIGGCGLGVNVATGLSTETGALVSSLAALLLFWRQEFGTVMDSFTKVLGFIMIALTLYVAIASQPPLYDAVVHTFYPQKIDIVAIVTLVGGTVGGYISFAGAHRLLDAGIKGQAHLPQVSRSAYSGILITGTMRIVLFLAVLGVVVKGNTLADNNPAASVFRIAAGETGYRFFGVVMWSAAITSVVGCSYTSISFLRTLHPWFEHYQRCLITGFILLSSIVFIILGNPVKLLVSAGAINGLILPITLAIILLASRRFHIVGTYRHPLWMQLAGWAVVLVMGGMSVITIAYLF